MEQFKAFPNWYDNKIKVLLLCIFFFPLGVYGLWMNKEINQKWKVGVTVFYGIYLLFFFMLIMVGIFSDTTPRHVKTKEEDHQEWLQKETQRQAEQQAENERKVFAGGYRCLSLEQYVQDHMNDPDSFEQIETIHTTYPDYYIVVLKYRGKNAFGGTVTEVVKAKVGLDGSIIEILDL